RLRVVGPGELPGRAFPHDPRQRDAQSLVDSRDRAPRCREAIRQVLAHADLLCALAGAHHHRHHRTTALPQVKPAPNATNRSSEPFPMRPSSSACSSAMGIEAEEVLPYLSRLTITFSIGMPACFAVASMIR